MAWTTIVQSIQPIRDALEIVVVFVDDLTGRKEQRTVQVTDQTQQGVRQALRRVRDLIGKEDKVRVDVPLGVPFDIDAPDDPLPPPTQAEIDYRAYQIAYLKFNRVRTQFIDGLVEQAAVDAAFKALHDAFKTEYIGL